MSRRTRLVLAGLGAWYAIGIGHDLLVHYAQDAIDEPFATVRCSGRALNVIPSCVGEVTGPLSTCERAVLSGCDWFFPGSYLSQWMPR